jgi:tRNA(Ile)-lysidine synthase
MDRVVRNGADDTAISDTEAAALFADLADAPALVLAVSGGPDSTALLWLAARWRARRKRGPTLVAVTIDHGLRPESAKEALAAKRLARRLGVAHRTTRWRGRKPATGVQQAARAARYRLLAKAARANGAPHVLTAHTLDDQAETVLFRLARGSGLTGLKSMARVAAIPAGGDTGVMLVRPLLGVPKSRLLATLGAAGIPFADDPSNRDPRFTRPRLRQLMPGLAAEGLDAARLAAFARRAARADAAIDRAVDDAAARLCPGPWPRIGPITLDAAAYATRPAEVTLRLLGRAIAHVGNEGPVELGKLEALHAALDRALGQAARFRRTLAGAVVTFSGGRLTLERAPPRRPGAKTDASGRKVAFTNRRSNDAE